jgi:hypothetical protein
MICADAIGFVSGIRGPSASVEHRLLDSAGGAVIAALYIDPRGPYPRMPDVECWDEARDARTYPGPWPVVAHPPCGPWGVLRHFSKETTADCALLAIESVRRFGGVLEHPVASRLFEHVRAPRPGELPDAFGGYTVDVEQVSWGHACRKPTRLYFVGVPRALVYSTLRCGGEPTHQIWGSRASGHRHRTDLRAASAAMRRRTPPEFARWLVELARATVGSRFHEHLAYLRERQRQGGNVI